MSTLAVKQSAKAHRAIYSDFSPGVWLDRLFYTYGSCVSRTTSSTLEKKLLPYIVGIASGGVAFVAWFTYTELFIIRAI